MKLNPSYIVAGVFIAAVAGWFLIGSAGDDTDVFADVEARSQATEAPLPTVVVRSVNSETHPIRLTQYGRTEPNRRVEVKAKTPSAVAATPVAEGSPVQRGTVICRQDMDARRAVVDQARAQLAKAEADLAATTALVDRGFRAPTSLNADRAAVDAARASLTQAEIEMGNIVLRAPFTGIYEERLAEVGDYLSPGQPCAAIVELDPLKLEVELTETQVGQIRMGKEVDVVLATGEAVTGTVAFIESVANPATRTFQMDLTIPNEDYRLKAGVSATAVMTIGETQAIPVPSGILTLDDSGQTGVRYLDDGDRVRFAPIVQVDETGDGLWVTGLPDRTRIIVEGQDFVSVGTQVDPVSETEARRSRQGAAIARANTRPELD